MRAIFSTSQFARNIDVTVGWIPPTLFIQMVSRYALKKFNDEVSVGKRPLILPILVSQLNGYNAALSRLSSEFDSPWDRKLIMKKYFMSMLNGTLPKPNNPQFNESRRKTMAHQEPQRPQSQLVFRRRSDSFIYPALVRNLVNLSMITLKTSSR